jgi:hypothetical protein
MGGARERTHSAPVDTHNTRMGNKKEEDGRSTTNFIFLSSRDDVGLVRTVVSISHCGCDDPGSIPGLDKRTAQPVVIF